MFKTHSFMDSLSTLHNISAPQITLYSQGPFGRRTAENLYVPPGSVRTVKWRKNIIIWSDDEVDSS